MKMILLVPMMIACSLLGCAADSEGCRPLQRGKTVHFDTDDKHYLYFWHKAVMASTQNNMTVSTMNVQKVIIFNSSIITHFKRTSIIYREKDTVTEISGGGVELTIIKPGMVKNVSVVSNGIMDWVICSSDEDFPSISENKFPITLMLVVALALVVLVVIFVAVAFIYRFKKTLFNVQAELNNYKKTIREHSEQEIQLPSANKWQQKVEDAYDEWNINSDVIRQECRNSIYVPADEIMDAHERLKPCEPI
ncbi:uncharacterized protein LOC121878159 isoform X2 [Homarus americanus]|uniref:uncharacterized protein LOC121878159 isoform X2 n=1 Tax=Homarus americanus TaxID=6706 RepID=UPI001C48710D|nr:uncharacterized protein LOC121878159 isoform X2 [Homarus americanus]